MVRASSIITRNISAMSCRYFHNDSVEEIPASGA